MTSPTTTATSKQTSSSKPKRDTLAHKTKFKTKFTKLGSPASALGRTTAPAPAPALPPPTPTAPAPWDSQYENTVANLNSTRGAALTNLAAEQSRAQSDYGYNMDGSENTSDPYSRLATLRADFEKIKRGAGTSYASRGQLYSGAYQNQINANQEGQNQSLDALRKNFQDYSANLRGRSTDIWNTYNSALTAAGNARIQQAADATATGESPTLQMGPTGRHAAVLSALSGKLSPSHRARLVAEARKNGWI